MYKEWFYLNMEDWIINGKNPKQTNTNETPNTFKPSIKCILFLLQLFYIFIYSVSISFLIFVYVFLLRKRSGEIIRQAVRRLSFHDSQPIFRRVVTFSNVGHSGGFYLRLGAIGNERFKASEWHYMNVQMTNNKNLQKSFVLATFTGNS